MTSFDSAVLVAQLEAVRGLSIEGQRAVGEVLVAFGTDLLKSADRLEALTRGMERLRRATRQVDAA